MERGHKGQEQAQRLPEWWFEAVALVRVGRKHDDTKQEAHRVDYDGRLSPTIYLPAS